MTSQPPQPPPKKPKSLSEVWAATSPADRRKVLITLAVLVVIALVFVVYAVGWNKKNGSGGTTPSGLDKAGCMALFDARVGHDPNDNAFWQGLVECANKQLLPPGQNDPGFYTR